VRIGDLISFKPKSFGEDDWSNPCIVLDAYVSDDRRGGGWKDTIWVVWCNGGKFLVNPRLDDIIYLTSSSHLKG
jgi:hypothetical protein